ncbi:MAG: hypothetical protein ABIR18_10550, partial [Chitinophagaceae bacterium]
MKLLTLLVTCFIVTSSCSQRKTTTPPLSDIYTGTTPCDSLIASLLEIPATKKNFSLKWDLSLQKNSPDTFRLLVRYGNEKPNTNEFISGGTKVILTGIYTVSYGAHENPNPKVYSLQADQIKSPLLLIEMDSNILHFADPGRKLLVGNGGWGYVFNKVKITILEAASYEPPAARLENEIPVFGLQVLILEELNTV